MFVLSFLPLCVRSCHSVNRSWTVGAVDTRLQMFFPAESGNKLLSVRWQVPVVTLWQYARPRREWISSIIVVSFCLWIHDILSRTFRVSFYVVGSYDDFCSIFSVSSNSLIVPGDIILHLSLSYIAILCHLLVPSILIISKTTSIGGCHVRRGRSMRDEHSQQHTSLCGACFCL